VLTKSVWFGSRCIYKIFTVSISDTINKSAMCYCEMHNFFDLIDNPYYNKPLIEISHCWKPEEECCGKVFSLTTAAASVKFPVPLNPGLWLQLRCRWRTCRSLAMAGQLFITELEKQIATHRLASILRHKSCILPWGLQGL